MRTFLQSCFCSLFFIAFTLSALAQNSYSFNNDRSIKIKNPFNSTEQATIYFQVKSTSTSMASGYGSYARIFGAPNYNLEIADHKGKLALYTGRVWCYFDVDLRKEMKDIFIIFEKGFIKIIVDGQLIDKKKAAENKLHAAFFYIGSTYTSGEKFKGQIDNFAVYNRVVKTSEIADIEKFGSSHIQRTYPEVLYDFTKGIVYKKGVDKPFENMPQNIGIKKQSPRVEADVVEFEEVSMDEESPHKKEKPQVEVAYETIETPPMYGEEPVKPDPNKKFDKMKTMEKVFGLNFNIKFSEIDRVKQEFEGKIKSNILLVQPGSYDMIIDNDGNVTIKVKTQKDD